MNNKTVVVLIFRVFAVLFQLLYIKVYTHYLTLDELGYFFYLATLSYAINALILVPSDFFQQAKLIEYYDKVFPLGAILSLNVKIVLLSVVTGALFGIPVWLIGKITFFDLFLIIFLALFLYFCSSTRNYLNNRGNRVFSGAVLLVEAIFKVLVFIILLKCGFSNVSALIGGMIATYFFEFLVICVFFYVKIPLNFVEISALNIKSLMKMGGAISFAAVCNWLQLQGYRIVYVWLGVSHIAGAYAAVSNIGIVGMAACSAVFSQIFLPKIYASKGAYLYSYLKKALLLSVFVLFGYGVLGKYVLIVLTKKEFLAFSYIMLFGVITEAANLIIGAIMAYCTINNKTGALAYANIAGLIVAVVGVSCSVFFKPNNYILLGASLALSQVVVCAFLYSMVNKTRFIEKHNG